MSAYELAEELANAIRDAKDIATVYAAIPAGQRTGLSLDQFQQYIKLLRRGMPGNILSFSPLSATDVADTRKKILERLPGETQADELLGFWIHYLEAGRTEGQFAIYIHQHEGLAYLSADWIKRILNLADFSTLYFDAIDKGDTEALAALLQTGTWPKSVRLAKARQIIEYYQHNVSTGSDEYQITHIRIDSLAFEEYGITNPDQSKSASRTIELLAMPGGRFGISDSIPAILQADDIRIRFNGQNLLDFIQADTGQPPIVRSANIENLLGPPLLHDDTNCQETTAGTRRLTLAYQNLNLNVLGTCSKHQYWTGQITRLNWENPACSLTSGISPGLSIYALLELYPSADANNYEIVGYYAKGTVHLKMTIQNDRIAGIEMSWIAN